MQQPIQPAPPLLNQELQQNSTQIPISNDAVLAHSGDNDTLADIEATTSRVFLWIGKIVGIGLTLQALYGLYKSVVFIMITMPYLDTQLSAGMIERNQVIVYASKGIIEIIGALISMFFALRLKVISEESAEKIDTFIGFAILFLNAMVIDFFRTLDVDIVISELFQTFMIYLTHIPQRIISTILSLLTL